MKKKTPVSLILVSALALALVLYFGGAYMQRERFLDHITGICDFRSMELNSSDCLCVREAWKSIMPLYRVYFQLSDHYKLDRDRAIDAPEHKCFD